MLRRRLHLYLAHTVQSSSSHNHCSIMEQTHWAPKSPLSITVLTDRYLTKCPSLSTIALSFQRASDWACHIYCSFRESFNQSPIYTFSSKMAKPWDLFSRYQHSDFSKTCARVHCWHGTCLGLHPPLFLYLTLLPTSSQALQTLGWNRYISRRREMRTISSFMQVVEHCLGVCRDRMWDCWSGRIECIVFV